MHPVDNGRIWLASWRMRAPSKPTAYAAMRGLLRGGFHHHSPSHDIGVRQHLCSHAYADEMDRGFGSVVSHADGGQYVLIGIIDRICDPSSRVKKMELRAQGQLREVEPLLRNWDEPR